MMRSLDSWPLEVAFLFRPAPKSNDFVGLVVAVVMPSTARARAGRIEWSRGERRFFHLNHFETKIHLTK